MIIGMRGSMCLADTTALSHRVEAEEDSKTATGSSLPGSLILEERLPAG